MSECYIFDPKLLLTSNSYYLGALDSERTKFDLRIAEDVWVGRPALHEALNDRLEKKRWVTERNGSKTFVQ